MRYIHIEIGIKRSTKATLGLYREKIAGIEDAIRKVFEKNPKNEKCIFRIVELAEETNDFDVMLKIIPGISTAITSNDYAILADMKEDLLEQLVRARIFTQPLQLMVLLQGIESFCGVVTIGEKVRAR